METLLPMGGVLVGAAATLLGQLVATRERKREVDAAGEATMREERKHAILDFLDISQQVGTIAMRRHLGDELPEDVHAKTDLMWLRQKYIEIAGSPALQRVTREFADRLMTATYREVPAGIPLRQYLEEGRTPVIEAAREELGFA
ncbi:hypothetical protein, partial [Nonomuraea sp. bgisy094]|uniref:hypothetical protein n=1 Tax=Nonomuraea sp. bgisy094 TaxID=3413781 RepID=UPI003EBB94CB